MQNRFYRIPNAYSVSVEPLLDDLRQFFLMQGHQVQIIPIQSGQILQAQKDSALSTLTGQSSALTVKVMRESDGLRIEVGNSKWLDKAAVGLVGYALLPPLILLPIVGAINQFRLSEDVWEKVEAFIARCNAYAPPPTGGAPYPGSGYGSTYPPPPTYAASSYTPPPAQKPERSCTSCQASLAAGAIFCSRCGSK
ncbi:MAG: hypothetical protein K1Y36_05235, partial [Blastocatellia bacterium]|nr:hypothetical protein [Blastocatellia bacterium]